MRTYVRSLESSLHWVAHATSVSQGNYCICSHEPPSKIEKNWNNALIVPFIRVAASSFLWTMLMSLMKAVASWKLSYWCLMDVSWLAFCWSTPDWVGGPYALVCGSGLCYHFPAGDHLLYLIHPHLGWLLNLVMVSSSAPSLWHCHMYSFFGSSMFCIKR
jgi:hypothetical protein